MTFDLTFVVDHIGPKYHQTPVFDSKNSNFIFLSDFCVHFDNFILKEAIDDINFPEKILEELECLENLTSCHKVGVTKMF